MGELASETVRGDLRYGTLAVRFNALRHLYNCVRTEIMAEGNVGDPQRCAEMIDAR